jgi:hypothetical protein
MDARQKLETIDLSPSAKADVVDDLDKMVEELKKGTQPDEGRLRRLLHNIKEVAPPVAAALSIAASLQKLMS